MFSRVPPKEPPPPAAKGFPLLPRPRSQTLPPVILTVPHFLLPPLPSRAQLLLPFHAPTRTATRTTPLLEREKKDENNQLTTTRPPQLRPALPNPKLALAGRGRPGGTCPRPGAPRGCPQAPGVSPGPPRVSPQPRPQPAGAGLRQRRPGAKFLALLPCPAFRCGAAAGPSPSSPAVPLQNWSSEEVS